jgi:hypothetical protein
LGVYFAIGAAALAIDFLAMWWGKHKGDSMATAHAATAFQVANAVEAGLWVLMGLCIFIVAAWKNAAIRGAVPAITLIVFGCSDVVEVQTGAWWRPWWLLVWKILCVLVLVGLLADYYLRRRKAPNAT